MLAMAANDAPAQDRFLSLTGHVTDAQTGQGIPFASIYLRAGTTGTATNTRGEFVFKYRATAVADTLVVSCVGYRAYRQPLQAVDNHLVIALEPAVVMLTGVTVTARTGLEILKEAVEKIPRNYDTTAVQYTAFYRENVWLGDVELSQAEAVLDIYRPFRAGKDLNEQIRLVKGRKKKIDYGREAQLYYMMSGASNGARGSLSEDMVKYCRSANSPLNPQNYRYYDYIHTETIREGDRDLLVLDVIPRRKARKGYLRMRIFLDDASLAIVKYNFELSEAGLRMVSRKDKGLLYAIMAAVVHVGTKYHTFQYTVSYTNQNDKWYLNQVTRHWEILVDSKKRNWKDRVWRTDMDLVMTDLRTDSVQPITADDIAKNQAPMHTMISSEYDEAFWEDYNVLKTETTAPTVQPSLPLPAPDTAATVNGHAASNRQHGFTRADTLRGKLTPLRTNYDVTFYHLDVALDLDKHAVQGTSLMRFRAQQPIRRMQVDLYANMVIDSIVYRRQALPYSREFNAVFIDYPEPIPVGTEAEVKIYYNGIPKAPNWNIPMDGGVLWDQDSLGNLWAQVVCQGSGASLWWPNKDHQSDEPDSMKIWITVPDQYTEISNGRLQRTTPLPGNRLRYEWYVSYPINNYNVTFNVGHYTHYRDRYISDDTLTLDYYVMPYHLARARRVFQQVKPMLKTFEKSFGKYPFKRDGFTLLESLYPMEHQSGVCIGKLTAQNATDNMSAIWHESAHEWWGNALTSKDIADMWIHEGFATYAEIMIIEDWFGKDHLQEALDDQVNAVAGREPVLGVYNVNHIHYDIGDMYSKGSLLLHTFRSVLNNDTLWVNLLRDIQQRFRYQTLTTNDLVAFVNARTRTDYTYLFDQYLRYTNLPRLTVALKQKGKHLAVTYAWQADVKSFRMPVRVTTAPEKMGFIYPTTQSQTLVLKGMSLEEFDVDTDNFYIDVEVE